MTTVRAFIRQRSSMEGSISSIVSDVNQELVRDVGKSGHFISLFYIQVDRMGKAIHWVRVGHEPGILYNPDSDTFNELTGQGLPLGIDKDSQYKESDITINTGQIIVIATDGIWEAHNQEGEMFGKERLRKTVRDNADRPAREIVNMTISGVESFRSSKKQEDDLTMVVIKVE